MPTFVSFGFEQPGGIPERAHLIFDVRELFLDPHGVSPEMREMNGLDQEVIDNVLDQAGAREYVAAIADLVERLAALLPGIDLIIAVGCVGGRHRSVVLAEALYLELFRRLCTAPNFNPSVSVEHRDIGEPIIERP